MHHCRLQTLPSSIFFWTHLTFVHQRYASETHIFSAHVELLSVGASVCFRWTDAHGPMADPTARVPRWPKSSSVNQPLNICNFTDMPSTCCGARTATYCGIYVCQRASSRLPHFKKNNNTGVGWQARGGEPPLLICLFRGTGKRGREKARRTMGSIATTERDALP